jgi:hypothetical protein
VEIPVRKGLGHHVHHRRTRPKTHTRKTVHSTSPFSFVSFSSPKQERTRRAFLFERHAEYDHINMGAK